MALSSLTYTCCTVGTWTRSGTRDGWMATLIITLVYVACIQTQALNTQAALIKHSGQKVNKKLWMALYWTTISCKKEKSSAGIWTILKAQQARFELVPHGTHAVVSVFHQINVYLDTMVPLMPIWMSLLYWLALFCISNQLTQFSQCLCDDVNDVTSIINYSICANIKS